MYESYQFKNKQAFLTKLLTGWSITGKYQEVILDKNLISHVKVTHKLKCLIAHSFLHHTQESQQKRSIFYIGLILKCRDINEKIKH